MADMKVTVTDTDGTVHEISDAREGATLMQTARGAGVDGIIAECGGACSCATCHVYVAEQWRDLVGPPDDVEEDMLDMVDHVRRPNSRLSCQIVLRRELEGLEVEVAPEL